MTAKEFIHRMSQYDQLKLRMIARFGGESGDPILLDLLRELQGLLYNDEPDDCVPTLFEMLFHEWDIARDIHRDVAV